MDTLIAFLGLAASLAFLVFLVMAIVGWARKNGKAKRFFIYSGSSFVLMMILVGVSPNDQVNETALAEEKQTAQAQEEPASKQVEAVAAVSTEKTSDKTSEDQEAKAKAEAKEKADQEAKQKAAAVAKTEKAAKLRNKQLVVDFEKEYYGIESNSKNVFNNYVDTMGKLADGKTDIYTAYSAAKDAKDAADAVASAYYKLEPSEDLPDDVQKLLQEAALQTFYAYSTKADAFDSVLEFFDEQKPSLLQEYKDNIALSDKQIMQGVFSLVEAKEKVGLDTTKINK